MVRYLLIAWFMVSSCLAQGLVYDGMSEEEAVELGMTALGDLSPKYSSKQKSPLSTESEDALKAQVVIFVNKAARGEHPDAQTLKVYIDGQFAYAFTVSTGSEKRVTTAAGKTYVSTTPTGYFRPRRLYRKYYSSLWGGASMHYAVFYIPGSGIALHATTPNHYRELGRRASGGCVRLHPTDAASLQKVILDSTELATLANNGSAYADPSYFYDEKITASNGKSYIRKRYDEKQWAYPVLGVYRKTGQIYNETLWNSSDVLIVVKNGEGL